MPTWGEILQEVIGSHPQPLKVDVVRWKYLKELHLHTKRNVILYASSWTQANLPRTEDMSINEEDMQGFMEVVSDLDGDSLDLILHSPGGTAEVAESIVSYLRKKFDHIRVIVPHAAMSAAIVSAIDYW